MSTNLLDIMPSDECTPIDLEIFFNKKLYNDCQATDELFRKIHSSQDDSLAKKVLLLYQEQYNASQDTNQDVHQGGITTTTTSSIPTTLSTELPAQNVNLMYGLGLIYMHFNAYQWAIKIFREILYIEPNFSKSRDCHTRLGLIFKSNGSYKLSEKHFNLAINDKRPTSGVSSKAELRFHLAHLYELQGKLKKAKECYEKLLQEKDLPNQISANIHRQLGCIHFHNIGGDNDLANIDDHSPSKKLSIDSQEHNSLSNNNIPSGSARFDTALSYLNTSYKINSDPKTSYYLGRCFTTIGKFQDAFASYRSVIDREESTADTWCSVGVLYHRQNQPTDALQAYIRAVQFDKQHYMAWMNLGILYECHKQFKDALKCYQHVIRTNSDNNINEPIEVRISFIQKQITELEASNNGKTKLNSDKLLCLEDLWNLESKTNSESNNLTTCNGEHQKHMNDIIATTTNLVPSQNKNVKFTNPTEATSATTRCQISAEQVIEAVRSSTKSKKIDINLLTDDCKLPHMFIKPPPYPPFPTDKLLLSPASIFLETKKDLASTKLQDFCQSSPISIVRNIASVLKLDLGLFSTKALVEQNPNQEINILSHIFQQFNENHDEHGNNRNYNAWTCDRKLSSSTISRFASYQVATLRESLQDEKTNKQSSSNLNKESETDSNESASAQQAKNKPNTSAINHIEINNQNSQTSNPGFKIVSSGTDLPASKKLKRENSRIKYVRAAINISLSDEKFWRPQLFELNKLPHSIKCVSAANMLTHIGNLSSGFNSVMLSMHVPGCRVVGNRQTNSFCSVNINTGPGDHEWFAISAEHVKVLAKLCKSKGYEIDNDNWWPRIRDLIKYHIPVYRFSQRPGDLVWVNSGTVYWVQAVGWCNNIHWNVGPLNISQFKSASQIIELNKLLFKRSEVPMVQMTWNIIINIHVILDDELYYSILNILRRSLQYCALIKNMIDGVETDSLNIEGATSAEFCSLCECETFNFRFITKQDSTIMHCFECSRRFDSTFQEYHVKQSYDLKYLMKLYDNFIETKKKLQSRQSAQQKHMKLEQ